MAGLADLFGPATDIPSSDGNDVVVQANPRTPAPSPVTAATLDQNLGTADPNIDMGTLQSPTPPGLNYDNSRSVAAVQAANDANPARGGSANPGLYGLLPQGLQHGTLRNVLGALGDAFLVQAGHDPEYANNMARQNSGNAIAGMNMNDPNSVQAATQRLAATGSPDAMKYADAIQTQAENAQMRKAQMDYNNIQRAQMNQIRFSGQYQNIGQKASGQISTATAATYPQLYAQLDRRVKQLDPSMDAASALNIPAPEDFQEGSLAHYGETGNNVVQSTDRAAQRQQSGANAVTAAGSRIKAATIGANSHTDAATIGANRPDEATFQDQYIAAKKAGQPTTTEEDARFAHDTQLSKGRGNRPNLIGVPGGGHPAPAASGAPVPTNRDVSYLKSHPEVRAQFESHFGKGAAAKYLGH